MKTERLALYGLLTSLALILSYLESLLPLYRLGGRGACTISLVRVLLASILFGNLFSLAYGAAGASLSLLVMLLLKKSGKFSVAAVSVAGGVAHNAGQIIVAIFVLETRGLIYYLPPLCVSGVAAGLLIGLSAALLIKRADIGKK